VSNLVYFSFFSFPVSFPVSSHDDRELEESFALWEIEWLNFIVSVNKTSAVHCGKPALAAVCALGSSSIFCLPPLIPAEASPAAKPLPLIFFFFSRCEMGLESHCRSSDSSSSSSASSSSRFSWLLH